MENITYIHNRKYDDTTGEVDIFTATTIGWYVDYINNCIKVAIATCCYPDQFNKRIGREIVNERLTNESLGKYQVIQLDELQEFMYNSILNNSSTGLFFHSEGAQEHLVKAINQITIQDISNFTIKKFLLHTNF